jgi:hypothetical protein
LVIEVHYVVIPAYIYVNGVTRGLKWNKGLYAAGESVRIGWRCGWGGQFMAFISVVSVHIVKSVAPFGFFGFDGTKKSLRSYKHCTENA